jgi:hypothetical protein
VAKSRRPKNLAQAQFFDLAMKNGFTLTSRGWPTFFVQKAGRTVAVEVVSSKGRKLREDKKLVVAALQAAGIECFLWSPEEGFTSLADSDTVAPPLGERGDEVSPSTTGEGSGERGAVSLFETPATQPSRDGSTTRREEVDEVWACYVLKMKPTSTVAGEEERKIIRNALKVASVRECKEAIEGCALSDWHMGNNPQGVKYNKLSNILRGKRGKKTTREQIDMLREKLAQAVAAGHAVNSSVDPALVSKAKDDVRRGFRLKGDPDAVKQAEASERWLAEHGIPTQRRADGYPIWPSGGNG